MKNMFKNKKQTCKTCLKMITWLLRTSYQRSAKDLLSQTPLQSKAATKLHISDRCEPCVGGRRSNTDLKLLLSMETMSSNKETRDGVFDKQEKMEQLLTTKIWLKRKSWNKWGKMQTKNKKVLIMKWKTCLKKKCK